MRPLALHSAASRASVWPSRAKSLLNWWCKKLAASGPSAAITPQAGRGARPLQPLGSKFAAAAVAAASWVASGTVLATGAGPVGLAEEGWGKWGRGLGFIGQSTGGVRSGN